MYQRMKYFFAVANFMSFTAAAEHMYVSQQAITRQIALLEQELGISEKDVCYSRKGSWLLAGKLRDGQA